MLLLSALSTAFLAGASLLIFGMALSGRWPPGAPLLGPLDSWTAALAVDLGLWLLFGLQHSGMARLRFKRWLEGGLPAPQERVLYVFASAICLFALVYLWQPLPGTVWAIPRPFGPLLSAIGVLGLLMAAIASMAIDGLDLIGLRRPLRELQGRPYREPGFMTPLFYRFVRHPIQLGVLLLLWGNGHMSTDRLVMALGATLYILVALPLEERDLVAKYGEAYRRYQQLVPRLVPRLRLTGRPDAARGRPD
jgi:protein-S-isoprenylcysteine O-methyltransferase Ste14